MKKLCVFGLFLSLFLPFAIAHPQVVVDSRPFTEDTKEWWQTASLYQIYPRSFKDSNGDGIGDLLGIAESQSMRHLQRIGITAFWLSPIFQSPMADFGYDISDYYKIQPEYGTMEDFDTLLTAAKEHDIKVILDFVPNHTSNESEWFRKSERREPGFEDYYMWHPGKPNPVSGARPLPPNNWVSEFRFSAWQWSEVRGEYYYHEFLAQQPDLNYRNPTVVEEMKKVLRFWLDKGVYGFRIDAVPNLFEVEKDGNGNYPDEPLSGNTDDPDDFGYLNHIYTLDQPETIDMVYQWRAVMDKYQEEHGGETRIILTETYSPIDIVMQYYGNATHEGAHLPFNFQMIMNIHNQSTAADYKRVTDLWLNKMPAKRTANWVMGNHDNNRLATRLGTNRIDAINMILLTLPGVSVTFNGEEIGMIDVWISWKDTKDPAACHTNPSVYDKVSRDPERTPFQWDSTTSAGFSTSNNTWLPVSPDYKTLNAEDQWLASGNSHLKVFNKLAGMRHHPAIQTGLYQSFVVNNVFVIVRSSDSLTFVTVANIGAAKETIDLTKLAKLPSELIYFAVSISSRHESIKDKVETNQVVVEPYESFVLLADHLYYYYYY